MTGPDLIDPSAWEFTEKFRWILPYLMSKLSTELHSKTIGV